MILDEVAQNVPSMFSTPVLLLACLVIVVLSISQRKRAKAYTENPGRRQPPGPPTLPVVGNLHQLGSTPHLALAKLAKTYGDVMTVHFGSVPVIIISSLDAAHAAFCAESLAFADRPASAVMDAMIRDNNVPLGRYGAAWQKGRRIFHDRLHAGVVDKFFAGALADETAALVSETGTHGGVIEPKKLFKDFAANVLTRAVFGVRLDPDSPDLRELLELLERTFQILNASNTADAFPWLPSRALSAARRLRADFDNFLVRHVHRVKAALRPRSTAGDSATPALGTGTQGSPCAAASPSSDLWRERESTAESSAACSVRQEHSLDPPITPTGGSELSPTKNAATEPRDAVANSFAAYLVQIGDLSEREILAHCEVMLAAGIDTSSTVLVWTVALLANNPAIQARVHSELDTELRGSQPVLADLPRLPYLHAVITEVLRLKPPAPLALPHATTAHTTLLGYDIPAGTQVLLNAKACNMDPRVFGPDPDVFRPERFLNSSNSSIGSTAFAKTLSTFGFGRRSCPGAVLAHRTVSLALARFLHAFSVHIEGDGPIELRELFGLTVLPPDFTVRVRPRCTPA